MIHFPRQITLRSWAAIVLAIAVALAAPMACVWTLNAIIYVGLAVYVAVGFISTCLLILGLPSIAIATAVFFGSAPRGATWRDRSRRTAPVRPLVRWSLVTLGANFPLYLALYFSSKFGPVLFD